MASRGFGSIQLFELRRGIEGFPISRNMHNLRLRFFSFEASEYNKRPPVQFRRKLAHLLAQRVDAKKNICSSRPGQDV